MPAENCKLCSFLMEDHKIGNPKEYLVILKDLDGLVKAGNFRLVDQTCGFDEVKNAAGCWYNDIIRHTIQCKKCGSNFVCWCDTYHGYGNFAKQNNEI